MDSLHDIEPLLLDGIRKIQELRQERDSARQEAKDWHSEVLRLRGLLPGLLAALEHVRDAYWTDGESFEERLQHIQEYASTALAKAPTHP